MAGDWIKLEHATLDKPEVLELAELFTISHGDALLLCLRFWVWADQQSTNGRLVGRSSCRSSGVSKTSLDSLLHRPGFTNAMIHIGWLEEVEGKLFMVNFDRHNGETSKKRALKTRAQAEWRKSVDAGVDAVVDAHVDQHRSTNVSTREEKRRDKEHKRFALPDWVPEEPWSGFIEMRQKKRNNPTDRAKQLLVDELQRLRDAGNDPAAVIDLATRNGWLSFYPPKGGPKNATPQFVAP